MLTYTPLNFLGRLGNQLFEIFSVISEAKKINKSWLFPDWKYKNHINIPHEWFSSDVLLTRLDQKKNEIVGIHGNTSPCIRRRKSQD